MKHNTLKKYAMFLFAMAIVLVFGMISIPMTTKAADVYRVTFNPNGGTGGNGTNTWVIDTESGKTVSQPTGVTRTGYTLLGWSENSASTGSDLWSFSTKTVTKNTTLFAIWKSNLPDKTITFVYYNNYGTIKSKATGTNSVTLTVKPDTYVYPGNNLDVTLDTVYANEGGYTSLSWYKDNSTAYSSSLHYNSITDKQTVNLYARFSRQIYFYYYMNSTSYTYSLFSIQIGQTSNFYTVPSAASYVKYVDKTDTGSGVTYKEAQSFNGTWLDTNANKAFTPGGGITGLTYNSSGYAYLYAQYSANTTTHKLTLNYNDDKKTVVNLNVPTKSTVTLATPTLSGAEFDAWYNNNTKWSSSTQITGDTTLNAVFNYTIEFELNGSTLNGNTSVEKKIIKSNSGIQLNDPGTPVSKIPNNKFVGWFSSATSKQVTFPYDVTSSQMLLAVFEGNSGGGGGGGIELAIVSYDVNGGTPAFNLTQIVFKGSTFPLIVSPLPTKAGYKLDGWYYNGKKWDFSTDVAAGNMTLVANWIKDSIVEFYIRPVSGTGSNTYHGGQNVLEGKLIKEPNTPTRNDAEFLGWEYTLPNSTTGIWNFTTALDSTIIKKYTTRNGSDVYYLYAKYKDYPKVTLIYDNGSNYQVTKPTYKKSDGDFYFHFPDTPTRYGYTFEGWYDASLGFDEYDGLTPITGNITLRARWKEADVKIWFDPNNGTERQYITTTIGSKIVPWVFDMVGTKGIISWHTDNKCTSPAVDFNTYIVTGNSTLYAKWGETSKVTITFVDVYNKVLGSLELDYGSKLKENQTPTLGNDNSKYIFQNKWLFDGFIWDLNVAFTTDITLTAYVKHFVDYDSNGGNSVARMEVFNGEGIYEPVTPVKSGYVFKGWYKDKELTDKWSFYGSYNVDIVTEHLKLYAKWEENIIEPDVIVPSKNYPDHVYINLSEEVFYNEIGMTVAMYSINGGKTWKKGSLPTGDKFSKLLNKELTLWIASKPQVTVNVKKGIYADDLQELVKNKGFTQDTIIIKFPTIEKRPKANLSKLKINYLDVNGDHTWILAKNTESGVPVYKGYEYTWVESGKKPVFTAVWNNFNESSFFVKTIKTKEAYYFRTKPTMAINPENPEAIKYTPASAYFKIKPAIIGKEPSYKVDYSNEVIKLKKGDVYSINGGRFISVTEPKGITLDISSNLNTKKDIIIRKASSITKPATAIQTIEVLPRSELTYLELLCANGKIETDLKKYEVYDPVKNKWGNIPTQSGTESYEIEYRIRLKYNKASGKSASADGTLKIVYGDYTDSKGKVKKGIIAAEIIP